MAITNRIKSGSIVIIDEAKYRAENKQPFGLGIDFTRKEVREDLNNKVKNKEEAIVEGYAYGIADLLFADRKRHTVETKSLTLVHRTTPFLMEPYTGPFTLGTEVLFEKEILTIISSNVVNEWVVLTGYSGSKSKLSKTMREQFNVDEKYEGKKVAVIETCFLSLLPK